MLNGVWRGSDPNPIELSLWSIAGERERRERKREGEGKRAILTQPPMSIENLSSGYILSTVPIWCPACLKVNFKMRLSLSSLSMNLTCIVALDEKAPDLAYTVAGITSLVDCAVNDRAPLVVLIDMAVYG